MSFLNQLGNAAGTVVGSIFGGPVGTVVGGKVGGYIGEAIDEQLAPPAPRRVAPPPKPAIRSKTIWLNLVISLTVALLGWAASFQWDQVVSPTLAVVIVGVANITLRFVSAGAIGRPEE